MSIFKLYTTKSDFNIFMNDLYTGLLIYYMEVSLDYGNKYIKYSDEELFNNFLSTCYENSKSLGNLSTVHRHEYIRENFHIG